MLNDQQTGGAPASLVDRMTRALHAVARERARQLDKWGEQRHHPAWWVAILTEEVGEVAKEVADARVQDFDAEAYRAELVQVAAVAVAAVEALDAVPPGRQTFPDELARDVWTPLSGGPPSTTDPF